MLVPALLARVSNPGGLAAHLSLGDQRAQPDGHPQEKMVPTWIDVNAKLAQVDRAGLVGLQSLRTSALPYSRPRNRISSTAGVPLKADET